MSAPIRRGDNRDKDEMALRYAPPWVRDGRRKDAGPRFAPSPPVVPEMGEPELAPLPPRFEGDVAMEAVRRRLSLEPQIVPEPPIRLRRMRRLPWLGRLAAMSVLAAGAAFGVTWLTSPDGVTRDTGTASDRARDVATSNDAAPAVAKSARLVPQLAPSPVERERSDASEPPALAYVPPVTSGEPNAEEPPAVPRLELDEMAALLKRGQALLKTGDIAAARLLLRRAATAGSAEAALALGGTYDGAILAELGVVGFAPENAEALFWYRKAAEGGTSEAERRLGRLRSRGE